MLKIKQNDKVQVIAGKDRGKKGKVLRLFATENRAIVEGVNLIKKHQRRRQQDQQSGKVEVTAPISISNLAIVCKNCNQTTRVKTLILPDGAKSRTCKKCKQPL